MKNENKKDKEILYKQQIKALNFKWFMTNSREEKIKLHDEMMKYQKELIELNKIGM